MTDLSDPAFYLPVMLGVIAVAIAGYALWRQLKDRKVAKATFDLLRTMRKELRANVPTVTTPSQSELRKRDQLEWRKLRDIAKAFGWIYDRLTDEED